MDGPNFLLQTLGPQQDQAAAAEQAGIAHGTQLLEAAKQRAFQAGETAKRQAWQGEQANLNRILQEATTRFGAQQGAAQRGVDPGALPPEYAGAQGAENRVAANAHQQQDYANVQRNAPRMLPSPDQIIGDHMMAGAQDAGPWAPSSAAPPAQHAFADAQLSGASQTLGVAPDDSRAQMAAPMQRVTYAKPGAPERDRLAEIDLQNQGKVAAAKARPRPMGRGGGTEADDLKMADANAIEDAKRSDVFKKQLLDLLHKSDFGGRARPEQIEETAGPMLEGYANMSAENAAEVAAAQTRLGAKATNAAVAYSVFGSPTPVNLPSNARKVNNARGITAEGRQDIIPKGAPRTVAPGGAATGNDSLDIFNQLAAAAQEDPATMSEKRTLELWGQVQAIQSNKKTAPKP